MDFSKLGNVELLKTFLALHYEKYDFFENELKFDPRAYEYEQILKSLKELLNTEFDLENLYLAYFNEAKNRGLDEMFYSKLMIESDSFLKFQELMLQTPTYVREIEATNFLGDLSLEFCDDEFYSFDLPVRKATKVLNEKGYITYWSSANRDDVFNRFGHIVKNKNVAYILIDPACLDEDSKKTLELDGDSKLWGIALTKYRVDEHYYGIWAEIKSEDALCTEISDELVKKAELLPNNLNERVMKV